MSHLAAVSAVLPEHQHDQQEVTAAFAAMLTRDDADRRLLERVHANAGVRTRHLVLPLSAYAGLGDFGAANDVFIREGVRLGTAAVRTALEQAGQCPEDVDLIISTEGRSGGGRPGMPRPGCSAPCRGIAGAGSRRPRTQRAGTR